MKMTGTKFNQNKEGKSINIKPLERVYLCSVIMDRGCDDGFTFNFLNK